MIEAVSLTKYHGSRRSVGGVSFTARQGEVLGFLGPNGAGKTTTIRMLTGLTRPTAGEARIGGHDVHREGARVRALLGFLPESAPLYAEMTLLAYLEFMAGIRGLDGRTAQREAERTSALLNLQKERPRLLRNLSKGTRQRVAIAQALLGDPEVLILDEPTAGLDPSQINDVRDLIKSLAGRRTVLFSTHILPEVEAVASRIAIIAQGQLVAEGTPAELVAREARELSLIVRGQRERVQEILRFFPVPSAPAITEQGEEVHVRLRPESGQDFRAELARAFVSAGLDLLRLADEQPRLEDIFLRAIGRPRGES